MGVLNVKDIDIYVFHKNTKLLVSVLFSTCPGLTDKWNFEPCIDNIKKWTRTSLEENVRLTEDRTAWRERSCAAGMSELTTPTKVK